MLNIDKLLRLAAKFEDAPITVRIPYSEDSDRIPQIPSRRKQYYIEEIMSKTSPLNLAIDKLDIRIENALVYLNKLFDIISTQESNIILTNLTFSLVERLNSILRDIRVIFVQEYQPELENIQVTTSFLINEIFKNQFCL